MMNRIRYVVAALAVCALMGAQSGKAVQSSGQKKAAESKPVQKAKGKAKSTAKATGGSKAGIKKSGTKTSKGKAGKSGGKVLQVPDPKTVGGESQSIVQVANLIYAGVKSSQCFSDHFLVAAEKDSAVSTSRRFHAVKADADEIFNFPLVIMTGEGSFELTESERANMRRYIERGGFLLASAGCSSSEWNQSFRQEMKKLFPKKPLTTIGMEHPVFNTVYEIKKLTAAHGSPRPLEGVTLKGRLGVIYSQDGLNDTSHAQGCCCCGGNEISNCIQVNVNILAYSLVY